MAPDPVTQERIYEAIKGDFLAGSMRPGARLEIQAIADRHRTSTTPVREVLHRLVGERLIEPRPEGGLRIAIPDGQRLGELYAWNRQTLLAALQMASPPAIREGLKKLRSREVRSDGLSLVGFTDALFRSIGEATGNRECVEQIQNASERLHYPRLGESQVLADLTSEATALVQNGYIDVRWAVARRIRDYHARRIEIADRIALAALQFAS